MSPYFAACEAERLRYSLEQHDKQLRKLLKPGVSIDDLERAFLMRYQLRKQADHFDQLSRPRGIQFSR